MNLIKLQIIVLLVVSLLSCEYYLGINQQPEFESTHVEEGLNIFGLLRPDSGGGYNRSFVFVQQLWPVLAYDSGYTIIRNVNIQVEHYNGNMLLATTEFPLMHPSGPFQDTLYRPSERFVPIPGDKYKMTCRYSDFPDATGECIFPPAPVIIENSLTTEGRTVYFTLKEDSLIKMVDVYLTATNYSTFLARIVPDTGSGTSVRLVLPFEAAGMSLNIYAYDANFARYFGDSNTNLNFNKYRTTMTTLQSGYGVFGGMNFIVVKL